MRRKLRVPQIAAVMGPCIAGGAYLPALSDVIIMVEGTSFMGLGGPNLVKGATGQVDRSGIARRRAPAHRRQRRGALHGEGRCRLPGHDPRSASAQLPAPPPRARTAHRPRNPAEGLYGVLPADHRLPYEIEDVHRRASSIATIIVEFQPEFAPEMLCANARLRGHPVAVIANRRGFLKPKAAAHRRHRLHRNRAQGGLLRRNAPSALGRPIIYLQDVSGFMVGLEAEREGIIRAGAEMVETMSCATVPQDRADAQSRQRRRLLRHGRPGLRSQLHLQLAHRAHRRDGRRIGRAGALLPPNWKS